MLFLLYLLSINAKNENEFYSFVNVYSHLTEK
ncbi:hypothetical protein Xbud_01484 [Xenorhabdus budapestensis]|uniref:Uncharacterized protein n=1 Tax=Xenorhabdus budapestensis TaxID=290110 RepID=A0A2D0J2A3_XENBU|nr:hypothetical protein Xbud_01484 [Xenorhabdus budapestensis]